MLFSAQETDMALLHKHGGTITAVHAIGHETYKGVADWFFFGTVHWRDGSGGKEIQIAPWAICCDDEDEPKVDALMKALNDYLGESGEWHDMKHKRDGRCYSWTPHKPEGRKSISTP
jgi:hypothetical protein